MTESDKVIEQAFAQPNWYLTKTAYNIRIRIETIKEFTQDLAPERILDIGCGDGSLSAHLLTPKNHLTLLDRSKAMLDIARSRIPEQLLPRVRVINNDFMSADLDVEGFDLIICVGVLAYIRERRAFIDKISSVLKPGGTVIFECTDGKHIITHLVRVYGAIKRALVGGKFPTTARPSSELVAMSRECGLQLGKQFRYALPLPGLRRLLPQQAKYRIIRGIYGTPGGNRFAGMGNECLYCFRHNKQHI
jgi:2-polyprenyl-3-methyl-5-hydroxy-6-metoxy-1,4-benzoquinol methylase